MDKSKKISINIKGLNTIHQTMYMAKQIQKMLAGSAYKLMVNITICHGR